MIFSAREICVGSSRPPSNRLPIKAPKTAPINIHVRFDELIMSPRFFLSRRKYLNPIKNAASSKTACNKIFAEPISMVTGNFKGDQWFIVLPIRHGWDKFHKQLNLRLY